MNDFSYLLDLPGEEREQDWIRARLETLSVREGIILAFAAQTAPPGDMVQAINQLQTLDWYQLQLDAGSYEQLGRWYLGECGKMPEDAMPYVDLAQIGKYYADLHPGQFFEGCYVAYPSVNMAPAYQGQGTPLPADSGWTVKLRISTPAVPEGVWLRLPWEYGLGDSTVIEEKAALDALRAQSWAECALLDARCVLPEAGNLMEQYSDVEELVEDSFRLDDALKHTPSGTGVYAAALRLENCRSLKFALDISENLGCYRWTSRSELEASAKEALAAADVPERVIQSGGIDLYGYGTHLLGQQGHRMMTCEEGCIARTSQEFSHGYNTPRPRAAQNGDVMNDFGYLLDLPGEERERRWLQERLETLSVREGIILAAAAQSNPPEDMAQAINQLQSLDHYEVRVGVGSYEALGRAHLSGDTRTPEDALRFTDLEKVGYQYQRKHPGQFVGNCYVETPTEPVKAVYAGPDHPLPSDDDWSVKLKLASPAVPEGLWMRLPGPFLEAPEGTVEETLALQRLEVQRWDECTLLEARCILPEAGNLAEQYSDIGDLIYDGIELGFVLAQKNQGDPHFTEHFHAALELEGCQNLRFALDISQNLHCYEWIASEEMVRLAEKKLLDAGTPPDLIHCIDLAQYAAEALDRMGCIPAADRRGFIARNDCQFQYQFSTPTSEQSGMMMQ